MNRYIILLRGINVAGKHKLPMADLRELLNSLAFKNVQTYIQSGNIILDSEKSKKTVCSEIHNAILAKFSYTVPVIAKTIPEWKMMIANNPFPVNNEKIVAFVVLEKVPEHSEMDFKKSENDQFQLIKDVVYIYCPNGFGKSKLSNNLFEKKLNVIATTRNYKTVIKLLAISH